ncbi:hypothetical protein [Micromonospora sediminicola]|uniref:hypothetical protein n=1 Tax=Micromonospora sediminicola TaxID=946078 RepID=UPI0037B9277B
MRLFAARARRLVALPDHRPLTVAAAVLVAVVMAAFGAAAGSWVAARTAGALPGDAVLADLSRRACGVDAQPEVSRETSPWTASRVYVSATIDMEWDAVQARQRYAAAGWSVSTLTIVNDFAIVLYPGDQTSTYVPSRYSRFTAQSRDLVVVVSGTAIASDVSVYLDVWSANTQVSRGLTLTGTILTLISGWLLTATLARRIRPTHPAHRTTVAALTSTALLVLATPTVALYSSLARVLFPHSDSGGPPPTVHDALLHGPYWPTTPTWLLPALTITGSLLTAVTLALAVSPQPKHTDRSASARERPR